MKQITLILLIGLVSCKKQTSQPQANTTQTVTVNNKSVNIYTKASSGIGTLKVLWDKNQVSDSVYTYSLVKNTIKSLQSDSIRIVFSAQICTSCPVVPNDVTVTVDGVVKFSQLNNTGGIFYWVKL